MVLDMWYRNIQAERGETCHHHFLGYSFQLASRDLLYDHPTDRMVHTTAFVSPAMELWVSGSTKRD